MMKNVEWIRLASDVIFSASLRRKSRQKKRKVRFSPELYLLPRRRRLVWWWRGGVNTGPLNEARVVKVCRDNTHNTHGFRTAVLSFHSLEEIPRTHTRVHEDYSGANFLRFSISPGKNRADGENKKEGVECARDKERCLTLNVWGAFRASSPPSAFATAAPASEPSPSPAASRASTPPSPRRPCPGR